MLHICKSPKLPVTKPSDLKNDPGPLEGIKGLLSEYTFFSEFFIKYLLEPVKYKKGEE